MLAAGFHGQALGTAEGDLGEGCGVNRAALGVLRDGRAGDGGRLGIEAVGKMETQCGAVYRGVDAVAEGLILEIFGVVHADGGAGRTPSGNPFFGVGHGKLPRDREFDVLSVAQITPFCKRKAAFFDKKRANRDVLKKIKKI